MPARGDAQRLLSRRRHRIKWTIPRRRGVAARLSRRYDGKVDRRPHRPEERIGGEKIGAVERPVLSATDTRALRSLQSLQSATRYRTRARRSLDPPPCCYS